MDFLKYLDVLIGLTIVMILLSPAVTAFTQLVMFAMNARSKFLGKGLTGLIRQLDGSPNEEWSVDGHPNATVQDAQRSGNKLVVKAADAQGNALPADAIRLKLIPRDSQAVTLEDVTGQGGIATIPYVHRGAAEFTSNTADVTVLDTNKNPVAGAVVTCSIKGSPQPAAALQGNVFIYPADTRPAPVQYDIDCVVTDGTTPLFSHTVRFEFRRNQDHDQPVAGQTGPNQTADFTLPLLSDASAQAIADAILCHPMISKLNITPGWLTPLSKKMRGVGWMGIGKRWAKIDDLLSRSHSGEVVEREELTRILLEFAAGEGAARLDNTDVRNALIRCLRFNGIPNPGTALADIRAEAQRLEKEKPDLAAHIRATEAIITAAKSDFVGRINAWFDQSMDRVSQRYGMAARIVTVFGALVVAFAIQMDSLDLLRRLSVDDKLRASLLEEAKAQQVRIDQLNKAGTPGQNKDELEAAKTMRDEIQSDLGKLRTPQMAILPDHFIWQRVPQARLMHNPAWKPPYPTRLELVVGSNTYIVTPRWQRGVLADLESAIHDVNAPVSTSLIPGEKAYLIKTAGDAPLALTSVTPLEDVASAELTNNPNWPVNLDLNLCLILDEPPCTSVPLVAARAAVIPTLLANLAAIPTIVAAQSPGGLRITAKDPRVRRVALLSNKDDPFSNVLGPTTRITRAGTITKAALDKQSKPAPSAALEYHTDALLLTSHRLGKLQLRWAPTRAETNILNEPERADWATVGWLLQPQLWGILLTWILLSMGAPFWYDTLKDLLKLRSSLASKEEVQRKERQEANPSAKPKTA
jgi:hypothetical protein